MNELPLLPVEEPDARLAAEIRQHYKLKLPDAFQAALAKRHGLRLVTRNSKDFDVKKFSFALIPYKI
jgi:predicted nucleic acid-binding protein